MRTGKKMVQAGLGLLMVAGIVEPAAAMTNTSERTQYVKTEVQAANAYYSDLAVKQAKYQEMAQSPFTFYRGTAHLYYKDMNNGTIKIPAQWESTADIKTWIQGDLHTQNLGFFDNNDGKVVLDLNDFDESYLGPFYWDLLRYTTSIFLLADEAGTTLTRTETRDLAKYFLEKYQQTLSEVNGNSTENDIYLDQGSLDGFALETVRDLIATKTNSKLLGKWTTLVGGVRTFNLTNPDLAGMTSADHAEFTSYWQTYLQDISTFVTSKGQSYFKVKDQAVRLNSGLGSRGVKKYYVLIEGPTSSQDDDVLLEAKEQRTPSMMLHSSMSTYNYGLLFRNHAERAETANKALLNHVDDHLGVLTGATRPYLLRKISPYKYGYDAADFTSKTKLENYLKHTAKATAYAHARADRDYSSSYVPYNFEANALNAIAVWPSFKTTVVSLGEAYYEQVKADHQSFVGLVNAGQLP